MLLDHFAFNLTRYFHGFGSLEIKFHKIWYLITDLLNRDPL